MRPFLGPQPMNHVTTFTAMLLALGDPTTAQETACRKWLVMPGISQPSTGRSLVILDAGQKPYRNSTHALGAWNDRLVLGSLEWLTNPCFWCFILTFTGCGNVLSSPCNLWWSYPIQLCFLRIVQFRSLCRVNRYFLLAHLKAQYIPCSMGESCPKWDRSIAQSVDPVPWSETGRMMMNDVWSSIRDWESKHHTMWCPQML